MSKSFCVVLLAAALCVSCAGSTGEGLHGKPTEVPLVTRNYEIVTHGLRAEACKLVILGFGADVDSYANAIEKIHEQVPGDIGQDYQLVNVVEEQAFTFYLIGGKRCTLITADVAVLLAPYAEPMVRGEEPSKPEVRNPFIEPEPETIEEPEVADIPKEEEKGDKEAKPKDKKPKGKKDKGLVNPY